MSTAYAYTRTQNLIAWKMAMDQEQKSPVEWPNMSESEKAKVRRLKGIILHTTFRPVRIYTGRPVRV
jgi:hypothetical protein